MNSSEASLKKEAECLSSAIVSKKNRTIFRSILDIHIESISRPVEALSFDTKTSKVDEMMKKNSGIAGFCITKDRDVIGVINRGHLNSKLSGPYGYCLYSNKSITEIMQTDFLKVDCKTPIDIVAKMAMERDYEKLYDFITVTDEGRYYGIVTVKDLLEKTMEIEVLNAKQLNPLTGLPGNMAIERELEKCIGSDRDCCVLYLDIDNFKAYNDVYGFENGDKIIKLLAEILKEEIAEDEFAGHIGGDDFVAVVSDRDSEYIGWNIVNSFDRQIKDLYSEEDIRKGFILSKNRYGIDEIFPIMSLSVAGITGKGIKDIYELGEAASKIKSKCKQLSGSVVMVDRK
jgi:GGDEF domain-containing protein